MEKGRDKVSERVWSRDFILICLGNFTTFASFQLLLPTLPIYVESLGGKPFEVGLVVGLFTIPAIILRPFIGHWMDRRGRRGILILGAVILMISSVLYNLASQVWLLLLLRLLHGVGWAVVPTATGTMVADLSPPSRRGEAMGLYGISSNLALAIGPALGLSIVHMGSGSNFRLLFMTAAAIATMSVVIYLQVHEPGRAQIPDGYKTKGRALLPALLPVITLLGLTFSLGTIVTFIPLYAMARGVENIAPYFIVMAFSVMLCRPLAGRLSDIKGRRAVAIPGLLTATASMVLLVFSHSLASFMVSAMLFGFGFGATHPALMAGTVDVIPKEARGAGMGIFYGAFDLGIGLGAFASGFIVQLTSYETLYTISALITLGGVILYSIAGRATSVSPSQGDRPP